MKDNSKKPLFLKALANAIDDGVKNVKKDKEEFNKEWEKAYRPSKTKNPKLP